MNRIFLLLITVILSNSSVFSQKITGVWSGTLDYGTFTLPIVFHITEENGVYTTTMDSPFEGVKEFKTSGTILKNKQLTISIPKTLATLKGKVKKNSIEGTFTHRGQIIPLILIRGEPDLTRRQTPQPPFPYHSEDVYFKNEEADITLAGTFTYPESGDNFPVAVLITGSGPQNRDSEIFCHRPFAVLADYLSRNGIAVLRYDDRGVGESEGIYHTASIQDFSTDALAAVSYLKTRPEINPKKIGIIGHSEGGSIAFMLAGNNDDLAFIVSMAGSSIKGDSLMKLQRELIFKSKGATAKQIAENEEIVLKIHTAIDAHTIDSVYNYPELFVDEITPSKLKNNTLVRDQLIKELKRGASPELYSIIQYDPTEDLQKIECFVFALNGEKDLQVPADVNLNAVKKYVRDKVTVKKYPNLNHLFQTAKKGLVEEYGRIEETIFPEVLEDISNWIKTVTRKE
jgi:dienelactone hydrolase